MVDTNFATIDTDRFHKFACEKIALLRSNDAI